jgi:hypothetical protein
LQWGGRSYNLSSWRSATSLDANSLDKDPQFVNAASHNFRLATGSPAIDAGVALVDVPLDLEWYRQTARNGV